MTAPDDEATTGGDSNEEGTEGTGPEVNAGPEDPSRPEVGAVHTVERTFDPADVRAFADVSGDHQPRHEEPDEEGRLLVHGLLTATLPTSIGGDLEVLARRMDFRFRRPVHTGDAVTCTWRTRSVDEREDRYDLVADVECTVDGETVLDGTVEGLVWKE